MILTAGQANCRLIISVETGESTKEISVASDELASLAVSLTEQVNTFKV